MLPLFYQAHLPDIQRNILNNLHLTPTAQFSKLTPLSTESRDRSPERISGGNNDSRQKRLFLYPKSSQIKGTVKLTEPLKGMGKLPHPFKVLLKV